MLKYCFKNPSFTISCNWLYISTFASTQGGPAGSSNTALNNPKPHPSHNTNVQLTHMHTSLSFWSSIWGRRVCQHLPLTLISHKRKVTWSFITKFSVDIFSPFQQIHFFVFDDQFYLSTFQIMRLEAKIMEFDFLWFSFSTGITGRRFLPMPGV